MQESSPTRINFPLICWDDLPIHKRLFADHEISSSAGGFSWYAFFWATHQGAEIDLVLLKDGRLLGVECKMVDAPLLTPSIRIALDDLKLERIAVVYPGSQRYPLTHNVEVVPLTAAVKGMEGLFPEIT